MRLFVNGLETPLLPDNRIEMVLVAEQPIEHAFDWTVRITGGKIIVSNQRMQGAITVNGEDGGELVLNGSPFHTENQ